MPTGGLLRRRLSAECTTSADEHDGSAEQATAAAGTSANASQTQIGARITSSRLEQADLRGGRGAGRRA